MALTITRPAIPVPLPLTRGGTEATTPAAARLKLELGDLALLTAPGGTSTFLRADKTWAVPAGGGGGSTTLLGLTDVPDTYAGQAQRVLAVKADETGTEFVTPAGGGGGAPTDAEYITSTAHASLSAERVLTDTATITWDRTTAGQIKANASGGGGYTDEQAQDAIGAMLADTATIALAYADATPSLSAAVKDASITEAKLSLSDVATHDASPTAHGLLRKLSGTATEYLNGAGAWTTPAGGGESYWSRSTLTVTTLTTGLLAFWQLEEASGNRIDRVGALALVPAGSTGNLSNPAGKTGQALGSSGSAYLTLADTALLSAGTSSFTIGCWVYFTSLSGESGIVGKGSATTTALMEYLLYRSTGNRFVFQVGNGSAVNQDVVYSSVTPVINTWYFVVGWYDAVADIQYIQVNNGTPVSATNVLGSWDSPYAFEVARFPNYNVSGTLAGRVDNVMFYRRVLTDPERTLWYNSGNGLDYPPAVGTPVGIVTPVTATDMLGLTASPDTPAGLGDGTLRWSGTDFEGRKGGAWVSMTAGAGGQPLDATLTALAGLATGADQLPYATGTDTFAQTPLTAFARTLLDDTTQAAMRTTLGLTPGTDVQAQDAELQALAGLTSAADRLPYFTGLGTAALATFTAAGRTLAGAADAAAQRTALALGTMAQQDAASVAITGGSAQLTGTYDGTYSLSTTEFLRTRGVVVVDSNVAGLNALYTTMNAAGAANKGAVRCDGDAPSSFGGSVSVLGPLLVGTSTLVFGARQEIVYSSVNHGIVFRQSTDAGQTPCYFVNMSNASVGSISTSATATAYNTNSDARLKHAIEKLVGSLDVVRALRPVAFRWNADDSQGHGFLAHELQQVIADAVTGEPDAVGPQGEIVPQQVDHSRIVPWLTAALQETLAQVQALQARVHSLEEALGL